MKKIKTTGFWVSLSGAVMLVVQTILGAFNITFNSEIVSNVVSAICGVLVVVGVLIPSKADSLTINLPGISNNNSLNLSAENTENNSQNITSQQPTETQNKTLNKSKTEISLQNSNENITE